MQNQQVNKINFFYYAILGVPLAFVTLPLNINIADFYFRQFHISLGNLALIILIAKSFNLLIDPLIGGCCDYLINHQKTTAKKNIIIASFGLAIGFFLLFNPNLWHNNFNISWCLAFSLLGVYFCLNIISINFESLAVIIAKNKQQRLLINNCKESASLIGFVISSTLPLFLVNNNKYFHLSLAFLLLMIFALIFFAKLTVPHNYNDKIKNISILNIIKNTYQNNQFMKLMLILLINSCAVALPANLLIFYLKDFLGQPKILPYSLALYSFSALFFMIFWRKIAEKPSKDANWVLKLWLLSTLGAVLTFIFAVFLQPNYYWWFLLISFSAGAFLGADLILPPTIIANLIGSNNPQTSSYMACYSFTTKLGELIASSSLFLLNFIYQYHLQQQALPLLYAFLPCLLKIIVVLLINKQRNSTVPL